MDGWKDREVHHLDGWMDGRMEGQGGSSSDGWMNGKKEGWKDREVHHLMDGKTWTFIIHWMMNGRMDGWKEGRKDGKTGRFFIL